MLAVYAYQAYRHYILGKGLYIHRPSSKLSTAENFLRLLRPDKEFSELEAKLASYSIVAEGQGTILSISDYLELGPVNSNDNIITVIYGTGEYYATTTDDYDFKVDEIYEATYANSTYSLRLASIEKIEGEEGRKLNFAMAVDGVTGVEKMAMVLEKPALKDVLYVPEDCVFFVDEKAYVYTLDDNGFREAVSVTVGQTIKKGEESLLYVFDIRKDRVIKLTLIGEVAESPRASYPRLVAEKGRNPEQFANGYDDLDQYSEPIVDREDEVSFMDDELPEGEE